VRLSSNAGAGKRGSAHGRHLHFDVKDYPVIMFRNMKELREGIAKRLQRIAGVSSNIE
jgi:hypothetical protein